MASRANPPPHRAAVQSPLPSLPQVWPETSIVCFGAPEFLSNWLSCRAVFWKNLLSPHHAPAGSDVLQGCLCLTFLVVMIHFLWGQLHFLLSLFEASLVGLPLPGTPSPYRSTQIHLLSSLL